MVAPRIALRFVERRCEMVVRRLAAAAEVAALLTRHLTGQPVEFGVHGVYSTGR